MHRRWVRQTQLVALSAWLFVGCSSQGGPGPEVPVLAGNGGGGMGGSGGRSETGGGGGVIDAGAGGGGGLGGAAGMNASGGVGGTAGMSSGGSGGVGEPSESCMDSDSPLATDTFGPAPLDERQALEKGTTVGTNGTFEDECDDSGDLIEQVCETQLTCNSPGGGGFGGNADAACAPREQPTGIVGQRTINCFGTCADGACEIPCPKMGDVVTVTAVETNSQYELDPGIEGLRFVCVRQPCVAAEPSVDDTLTVASFSRPFDPTTPDCRAVFGDANNPLILSDGCRYESCSTREPSTP
jgi:hypothetical protein